MSQPRQIIVLDQARGLPGSHALCSYPDRPDVAEPGQPGLHGRSAGLPTNGTDASNVRLAISYHPDQQDSVHVAGEGTLSASKWDVRPFQDLFIDVSGGAGGNGGNGEKGQQGGMGARGKDATRYSEASSGGAGAPGGNGGLGSSGADGGNAGHIHINVHESDLDCLVAITWDINGGEGGLSGSHGVPGQGGVGGQGGNGGKWTEKRGDKTITIRKSPGAMGPSGPPGGMPTASLTAGRYGRQGSSQIRVIRDDSTEATYTDRYFLTVTHFDIVDENQDGINEPGEHIFVSNIRVKNTGPMPSPHRSRIQLLINGTKWLEPIVAEPLDLPKGIQPGDEVVVPGVLKAFIRNELVARPSGVSLHETDKVRLVATFVNRLNRTIPEFNPDGTDIIVQYPLELLPPRCLDCVARGDDVCFNWMIKNVSTKAYGPRSLLKRAAGTKFADPMGIFKLQHPTADNEANDPIELLEPGAETGFAQDFVVNMEAMPYTTAALTLDLMLSDPHTGILRPVITYQLNIQISGRYTHSPLSSYLLVVNSKTPNTAIHQSIRFIEKQLNLQADIFNLSLYGSYNAPDSEKNVISQYKGKSVVIFGNSMEYFREGQRNPWDLLDAAEMFGYVNSGTNFLFTSVADTDEFQDWASQVAFGAILSSSPAQPIAKREKLKEILESAEKGHLDQSHSFQISKLLFRNMQESHDGKAGKAIKTLSKRFPLRRFLATHDRVPVSEESKSGSVLVTEGLPKTARLLASLLAQDQPGEIIDDYHMYMLVACLPFAERAKLLWNHAGSSSSTSDTASISTLSQSNTEKPTHIQNEASISPKIIQFVCLSIESQLGTDISHFLHQPPRRWLVDPIPANRYLSHLPHLSQFLSTWVSSAPGSLPPDSPITHTLSTIVALVSPLGFWEALRFLSRKHKLSSIVRKQIHTQLRTLPSKSRTAVQAAVALSAAETSAEIRQTWNYYATFDMMHAIVRDKLAQCTQTPAADFLDLAVICERSEAWNSDLLEVRREVYNERTKKMEQDLRGGLAAIREHVGKG